MEKLKDKIAIVTGAGGGIGKSIAYHLLKTGCKVSICDINPDILEETKKEFRDSGYNLHVEKVDVTQKDQIDNFVKNIIDRYGQIDILVNNAGIYPQSLLLDMPEKLWEQTINVNLKSVFLFTNSVVQMMKKNTRGGVIINAASFAALVPSAGSGAYAASKAGIVSLTKTYAAELAPFNIRVNGYIPGVIETPMTQEVLAKDNERIVSQLPLRRLGKPEDVAKAVLFLVSDDSEYVTGSFLEITGGKLCVQNPELAWQQ